MKLEPMPWMIATPLRRAAFVALHPEHAELAVETALGGGDLDEPLHSDLQDNPDMNAFGRLGSGRAGLYRGHYLKGIGRTRLAANWAHPADLFHHSGHQAPSGAIREYLLSTFLDAKGYAHLVNPCVGILLKPADPVLRDFLLPQIRAGGIEDIPPCFNSDLALQAVSVKRGGCVRFSNLLWLAHHLDLTGTEGIGVADFARIFIESLGEPASDDPRAVAAAMFRGLHRGLGNLRRFWELGVLWGSLHNNFAVDGRYVDLEGPAVLGRPLVGVMLGGSHDTLALPDARMLTGLLEAYAYAMYSRLLVWAFRSRFDAIAELDTAPERELADEIAMGFDALADDDTLFSREALTTTLLGWACEAVALTNAQTTALATLLQTTYDIQFADGTAPSTTLALRPGQALEAGPFTQPATPHAFDFMPPGEPRTSDEAALVNGWIRKLDEQDDLDRLLAQLGTAADEIRRYCKQDAS